jgi:hypothetical protein
MGYARQLLDTYPHIANIDPDLVAATIDALNDCAQACFAAAAADLSDADVAELVKCIRLCLDCADVCAATANVTSRQTEDSSVVTRLLLQACVATCKSCGDECAQHVAHHEHCRVCAEACRRCEQLCRDLLAAIEPESD